MSKVMYPDFDKNIVNISATLAQFLGAPAKHKTLGVLHDELAKDYKNVIFMCFDAMGVHPLNMNLDKDDFLRRHTKMELTSVFPSTTTNATTSLISADLPASHGWFGWSLYLKEAGKVIDLFCDRNHYDYLDTIPADFVRKCLPYDAYYLKVGKSCKYQISTVMPRFVKANLAENNYYYDILYEQFEHLSAICNKHGNQFVYSYNGQPDTIMHGFGVTSGEAKTVIESINDAVEVFTAAHPDTLLIITADHGQLDVKGSINTWEDIKLLDYLELPPYGDPRAMITKVKPDKHKQFLDHMKTKYKDDVDVFQTKDFIDKGVFGGVSNQTERLGDYIVVIKSKKYFRFCTADGDYMGMHTGLAPEEMLVPLIIVGNK